MSLTYQFKQAQKIINELNAEDASSLQKICREIQVAEMDLQEKSKSLMTRCIHKCGGICCKNVQLDLIISHWDFVFILALKPFLKERILKCLEMEKPFFSSDCIFLKDGAGPCIFPDDARPEVCIVTFCDDTSPLKKEIANVKRKFFKLTWFILIRKVRRFLCFRDVV
ncbi:MAG: hypothetical protein R6U27_06995 [Desulfobacterales bacterium]